MSTVTSFNNSDFDSFLKIKLKKPDKWNWELSVSKSSPNIYFPKIILSNEQDTILAEVDHGYDDFLDRPQSANYDERYISFRNGCTRHANLERTHNQGVKYINEIDNQVSRDENSKRKIRRTRKKNIRANSTLNFSDKTQHIEHEIPLSKSKSFAYKDKHKNVMFDDDDDDERSRTNFNKNIGVSRSTTITNTSSSRSNRGESSSGKNSYPRPSLHNLLEVEQSAQPRYFIRTSRAGTLIICEEGFNYPKERHRSKYRTPESFSCERKFID